MKYALFIGTLLLSGCGSNPSQSPITAQTCHVSNGTNGAIITCPDGSSQTISDGSPGPEGPQGQTGAQGQQGIPGLSGLNGTTITPVQFCAGYTPSYPTTFPEDGLCIGGNLYAVYWNGEAALTEIPPGYYSSTSTSAPCNFTVFANCKVSQ